MTEILILKTAALGDVLRTTSILPGLAATVPDPRVTWVTAPAAVDLVRTHPLVHVASPLDVRSRADLERAAAQLTGRTWDRVISLDDEEELCALAARLPARRLSGAYLRPDGARVYTPDVAPWFDMGLLSVHGKAEADRRKLANQRSQPQIYAEMLGIPMGRPSLRLPEEALAFGRAFAERHALASRRPVIGLNPGAGGRWISKQLPVERTVELARLLAGRLGENATFVVLGGEDEAERNARILGGLRAAGLGGRAVDAGTRNPLLPFASLVRELDLLVTSDSLALHVAIALSVRVVAFFAPTSAAEIELYGRGEKVVSTSPDYCSYRPDADVSSITAERLAAAVERVLAAAAREAVRPAAAPGPRAG